MKFLTALRQYAIHKLERVGSVDVVVGIPTYFSANTVDKVIISVSQGLRKYYPKTSALIFVSDGGSTDDTREVARSLDITSLKHELLVAIYRGLPGKGSAIRAVFEAAKFLNARHVLLYDSDLRSITPEWVKNMLTPLRSGYDFVAPYYLRYKYDGTITNTIAYPITRSLFGYDIRQPIGGDFGLSLEFIKRVLEEDVWDTDVARFGIDIWLTIKAITSGCNICQVKLGAKVHDVKDPAEHLGKMFLQVVGTLFQLMDHSRDYWMGVRGVRKVPLLGDFVGLDPQPFEVDPDKLMAYFRLGYENFSHLWRRILLDDFRPLERVYREGSTIGHEEWARVVYRFAYVFNRLPMQKFKVLSTMVPVYNAMVYTVVKDLEGVTTREAEGYFSSLAEAFERTKGLVYELWGQTVQS